MPGAGGTQFLPRTVGSRRAKEIVLTGKPFSAEEALAWGVVNKLCAPEKLMEEHSGKNAPARKIPRVKGHHADWLEAIRTGRQAGSNFGYGGPLTQVALLGAVAIRFPGQTLKWDNKAARFTNSKAANAYVHPPYREGWRL